MQTWAVWCQFSPGPEQALACFIYSSRNSQLHLTVPGCCGEGGGLWVFSTRGRSCSLFPMCSVAKIIFSVAGAFKVFMLGWSQIRNNVPFLIAYISYLLPTCRIYWGNIMTQQRCSSNAAHLTSDAVATWIKACFHLRQALTVFNLLGTVAGRKPWCKEELWISISLFAHLHQQRCLRSWQKV